MKGAPIRGPRFSGVDDNLSGFSDSEFEEGSYSNEKPPQG